MNFRDVILAASLFALTACSVSEDKPAEAEGAEVQDLTPEGPSLSARLFGGGEPIAINIQQAHPNRTVLQLTSLQVKPSETVLTAIVTNGDDREIHLNQYGNDDTYLAVSDGQKLYLSPPTSNTHLTIQPGQRMEAELVFLGELPKGQTATLMINDGNQTGNEHTQSPGFRLPLPLQDAAFSDDGSKKN